MILTKLEKYTIINIRGNDTIFNILINHLESISLIYLIK